MVEAKRDRAEVFVEYTKSICPVCKAVVDAQVNIRVDKVYLRKVSRAHDSPLYGSFVVRRNHRRPPNRSGRSLATNPSAAVR